jgi:hypothetical protein
MSQFDLSAIWNNSLELCSLVFRGRWTRGREMDARNKGVAWEVVAVRRHRKYQAVMDYRQAPDKAEVEAGCTSKGSSSQRR